MTVLYHSEPDLAVYQGDVLETLASLADESVHCVVTSPPYWGLRDYGTGEWTGGDPDCDHSRRVEPRRDAVGGQFLPTRGEQNARGILNSVPYRDVCGKCGATRIDQQIGLEQTPELYVARMVEVFREVRRVLRADGVLWLNLGSSYLANPSGSLDGSTLTRGGKQTPASRAAYAARRDAGDGGTQGTPPLDSSAPGYACLDLCGECADDLSSRNQRTGRQRRGALSPVAPTARDTSPADSAEASLAASALDVPASTTPESSPPPPASCWRCGVRSASVSLRVASTSSPDAAQSGDTGACSPGTAETSSAGRNQDTDASGMAWVNYTSKLKPKDMVPIPWMVAMALQQDGWYLRSDIIWAKCLSGGTRLYSQTQKGEQPATLKDLVRLDPATVKLWNGERWTQVVSWTPSDRDVQIEVELRNGERIGCTPEHRWPTDRGLLRADEIRVGDVIPRTQLPAPSEPRAFLPDEEIGYLVGLYLSEGSLSGDTVQIACHANEADGIAERLGKTTAMLHGTAVAHRTGGNKATVNLNGPLSAAAVAAYVSGSGSKGKHLSPRAWARSNAFLQAVIDGYLAGDGHWDGARWRLGFTKNDALADDLRTIGARLGLSVRLRRCVHRCQTGDFAGWRGSVADAATRRKPDGEVIAIRRSRARKFYDVAVADEPHLFALASGLLTHNSNPMPESVTDRPTKSHEYVFLLTKSPRYFYDADAIREPNDHPNRTGSNPRLAVDNTGLGAHGSAAAGGIQSNPAGRNIRSVWEIVTQPYAEAHFATFPEELPRRCIAAGTSERGCCPVCGAPWEREIEHSRFDQKSVATKRQSDGAMRQDGDRNLGGQQFNKFKRENPDRFIGWRPTCVHGRQPVPCTVLDPFGGAGTTALVARRLGRASVAIELNPEYAALIVKRLATWWKRPALPPDVPADQLSLLDMAE